MGAVKTGGALRINTHGYQMSGFVAECEPPMRVFFRTEQIPVKHNGFEWEYHGESLSVPLYL